MKEVKATRFSLLAIATVVFGNLSCLSISRELTENEKRSAFGPVSIVSLLSNPNRYDGKWVTARGYLSTGFEDSYLYLSKEIGDRMFHEYGIQVDYNEDLLKLEPSSMKELKDANHSFVSIYGQFKAKGMQLVKVSRLTAYH